MNRLLVLASPFVAIGLIFSIYTSFSRPVKAAQKQLSNAKPPANPPASAEKEEEKKIEPPFYGSTFYSGVVSSVYFYPAQKNDEVSATHIKWNFSDERDLWICGDVRSKFDVGRKTSIIVSFEPNQPCVTNWKRRP